MPAESPEPAESLAPVPGPDHPPTRAPTSRARAALPASSCAWLLLRPDRVRRALDERAELVEIGGLEPVGEVRHAVLHERTVEHVLVELGDDLRLDVAEVGDVAAAVDARHAVAQHAVADVQRQPLRGLLGVVLDAGEQTLELD